MSDTDKERAIAAISSSSSICSEHDALRAAYEAGRKAGIEEAVKIAEKSIGATRHEIIAEIRELGEKP